MFGIEISCLTSVQQAGQHPKSLLFDDVFIALKLLHMSMVGAPSHPSRLGGQHPVIRIAVPNQPEFDSRLPAMVTSWVGIGRKRGMN
jgi:hypothetical protein